MTKQEMQEVMEQVFKSCQSTREEGQKEYAHDTENAFRNFETTGEELNIPREKVLYIFLKKHFEGIVAYINGHVSQREPVDGRIKDAIVYLCLLQGMIWEQQLGTSYLQQVPADYGLRIGTKPTNIAPTKL